MTQGLVKPPSEEIVLSDEQNDIFEGFLGSRENLLVEACAGSGKTFLINYLLTYTNEAQKCLYLVFGKKNQLEAEEKMPQHVRVSTLHSFGLSVIKRHVMEVKIYQGMQLSALIDHFRDRLKDEEKRKETWRKIFVLDRVISILRASLIELDYDLAEEELDNYTIGDFDYTDLGLCFSLIRKFRQLKTNMVVDMASMIELPVIHNMLFPNYDLVCVDELQDLTNMNMMMVERIMPGRFIGVGDRKQTIYQFRGSKNDSMDRIKDFFDCVEFPLSVSRRCSKSVCELANKIYPGQTHALPDAKEGKAGQGIDLMLATSGDAVLCRTNLPLIDAYYKFLEAGKPCTIYGKEIEKGLNKIIKAHNHESGKTGDLLDNLREELIAMNMKASKDAINEFEEKVEAINILARDTYAVSELKVKIEDMFTNKGKRAIKLMSIHKSKGLEARSVFNIRIYNNKNLLPHENSITLHEQMGERCLEYVAITRAKENYFECAL